MDEEVKKKLGEAAGSIPVDLLKLVGLAVVAVILLYVLWKVLKGRTRELPKQVPELAIDVMALPTEGPPA